MKNGIVSYAAYVPRHRLQRAELDPAGKGARVVASYDEDSTTLAVEAARLALKGGRSDRIVFATTTPPYADKTNATAIHAALEFGHEGFAVDMAGSSRSGVGALWTCAATGGLAVLADVRTGRPGSADERDGADAAAAFLFGDVDPVAEILAQASTSAEFLDRWRAPGELASSVWEERFGLSVYLPLIRDAAARALAAAGLGSVDHVVVSSPHSRAAKAAVKEFPGRVPFESTGVGYAGAADAGVSLVAALDKAQVGETILLLVAADGCDATVLRATERIDAARSPDPIPGQLLAGRDVSYTRYLAWRGMLEPELPRRPEPDRPAGPPSARSEAWKFAFVGSCCEACSRVHLPPVRVCSNCGVVDRMQRAPIADHPGVITTYTVDRLAYSPSPPVIDAVVDFGGGGRYTCELTDCSPGEVAIGDRVEMTFRRLYTSGGVHNYFWKARPSHTVGAEEN